MNDIIERPIPQHWQRVLFALFFSIVYLLLYVFYIYRPTGKATIELIELSDRLERMVENDDNKTNRQKDNGSEDDKKIDEE